MTGSRGLALVVLLLVACGQDTNGEGGIAEPPWGLDTLALPSDDASVTRVLEAMPEMVAGQERLYQAADEVVYEQMKLRVLRLDEQQSVGTAGEYLERLAGSGEIEVETQRLDPDDDLAYLIGTGTGNGETVEVMAWGNPDSEWLFSLTADSPANRVALVNAFVDTVTSSG